MSRQIKRLFEIYKKVSKSSLKSSKQTKCLHQLAPRYFGNLTSRNLYLFTHYRYLSANKITETITSTLDEVTYDKVCTETLHGLSDYFEQLVESVDYLPNSDVAYSDGVLTVQLGSKYGTYVINRQTPNKQIWLSSPYSGPKRYDFVADKTGCNGKWIYRHTGETMHSLLQTELQTIFKDQKLQFDELPFSR